MKRLPLPAPLYLYKLRNYKYGVGYPVVLLETNSRVFHVFITRPAMTKWEIEPALNFETGHMGWVELYRSFCKRQVVWVEQYWSFYYQDQKTGAEGYNYWGPWTGSSLPLYAKTQPMRTFLNFFFCCRNEIILGLKIFFVKQRMNLDTRLLFAPP